MKKLLAILLALTLALTLVPTLAFAQNEDGAEPGEAIVEESKETPKEDPEGEATEESKEEPKEEPQENPEDKTEGETKEEPEEEDKEETKEESEGEIEDTGDVQAAPLAATQLNGTKLTQELIREKAKDGTIVLPEGDYYLESDIYLVGGDADPNSAWELNITEGDVTIDLNGHVLDLRGKFIYVTNALTLKDSNTEKLSHKFRVEDSGLWVWDETKGTETVTGGVITGGSGTANPQYNFGGGVAVCGGKFNMEGGSIVGCTADTGGGVYVYGSNGASGKFNMEGGSIVGCTGIGDGGGAAVGSYGTFTMKGGSIRHCRTNGKGGGVFLTHSNGISGEFTMNNGSIEACSAADGGGVGGDLGTITMTGGSIKDCTGLANGGGVYLANGTFTMTSGSIEACSAANGGGVYVGSAVTFNMADGSIKGCSAHRAGGGVFVSKDILNGSSAGTFTMNGGSIENCMANGVTNAVHADGRFDNNQNIDNRLLTGINARHTGAVADPILIGSAAGLKDFRDRVNNGRTGLCARLVCDIVLNDGTIGEDGKYTDGRPPKEVWTPIGTEAKPYTGSFDGNGHTIKGLYVAINMTTGEVFEPVERAGLFGCTKGAAIKNVAVTGYVEGTVSAGGIVESALAGTTIQNCINTCTIKGTTNAGGIVGYAGGGTVIENCLNTGKVSGTTSGGIAGQNSGADITNCFYLTGKAANAVGENTGGTLTNAEAKTRTQFANELLELLQNGDQNSPWTEYGYNQSLNMTLPLLKGQTGDEHTHAYVQTYNDTQHWKECACGVILQGSEAAHSAVIGSCTNGIYCECGYLMHQATSDHDWSAWQHQTTSHTRHCQNPGCGMTQSDNCSGGTATCTEPAVCAVCHGSYGEKDPTNHSGTLEWTRNATGHQQAWSCCHVVTVATEEHTWKNGACETCGYGCQHSGGTATCKDQAKCSICGEKYGALEAHSYSTAWSTDDAKHWHECTVCGAKTDETKHADTDKDHKCDVCKKVLSQCADNDKDHKCDLCGKTLSQHSGGTATCKDQAKCSICGAAYGQLDPSNHANLKHVDAKRATTRAEGNIEYWYCDGCGKYYKDEAAAKEITQADTVIAKKRRTNSDSTDSTGSTADKTVKSSQTGDPGVMLYVGLAAMSLTGGAWLRRKKH